MPISPTPPSGAKTSSSLGPPSTAITSPAGAAALEQRTRRRRRSSAALPSGRRSTRPPASSSVSKRPDKLAVGKPHADVVAEAGGAREPVGADGGKALARVPLRQPAQHLGRQRGEQRLGATRGAGGRQIGRRIVGVGRMAGAIDANPDRRPRRSSPAALSPSIRMPANFAPSSRRSFGHLIASCGLSVGRDLRDRVMDRERRDERQLRPSARAAPDRSSSRLA